MILAAAFVFAALGATRAINTAEAAHSKKTKMYATREELAGYLDGVRHNLAESADIVPGFKLTLDTSPQVTGSKSSIRRTRAGSATSATRTV